MSKLPKTPRPQKGPLVPAKKGASYNPDIGLLQEKLIGRFVVQWSRLEGVMEDLIWQLLNIEIDRGRLLTARLDTTARLKLIRRLAELRLTENQFHETSQIADRIDILREDRNLIVHGTWGRNDAGTPISMSIKLASLGPDQLTSEEFSHARMRAILHDTNTARLKLMLLMRKIGASPDISDTLHP